MLYDCDTECAFTMKSALHTKCASCPLNHKASRLYWLTIKGALGEKRIRRSVAHMALKSYIIAHLQGTMLM